MSHLTAPPFGPQNSGPHSSGASPFGAPPFAVSFFLGLSPTLGAPPTPDPKIDWPKLDWPKLDWPKLDWPKLVKSGWPKRDWPKSVSSARSARRSRLSCCVLLCRIDADKAFSQQSRLANSNSGIDPKDFAWDQSTSWWTEATFVGAIGTTSIHANSNFVTTFSPLNDFLQSNAQTSSGCSFHERWWALHENCSHGSNLVNPNLMGSATLTQLTAISCIITFICSSVESRTGSQEPHQCYRGGMWKVPCGYPSRGQ